MHIADIARVTHDANRALQAAQAADGIPVAPPWDEFPADERAGVIDGVGKALAGETPEQLHDSWVAYKHAHGWTYGDTKDAAAKTHPCLVPYSELPDEQRAKDALFHAIVGALR